jgi:poly-gamma-glutamate synthesis protein (capsule biosynthesis protein)
MKKVFGFLIFAILIGACVYGWSHNTAGLPEKLKGNPSATGHPSSKPIKKIVKKKGGMQKDPKLAQLVPAQTAGPIQTVPTVSLAAVGDVDMHMPIVDSAFIPSTQTYDFRPIFSDIRPDLESADFATGVLETQLGEPGEKYTGYPEFRSPQAIADALKWAGLKLVFTAHNHSLDQGGDGLEKTLRYLEKIDLPSVGCRYDQNVKPYYLVDCKGIRLGFLSYTDFTNGHPLPSGREWMVNMLDRQKVLQDIQEVKKAGADCIIMAVHTGVEYQRMPSGKQQELCDWLIRSGVDIILGSHVHVIQPLEKRSFFDPDRMMERQSFIAYSLGNLLSNQRWRYSDYGLLVKFLLTKKSEGPGVSIAETGYTPLWVNRYLEQGKYHYRIMKVTSEEYQGNDPSIDGTARQRMGEVFKETQELMGSWTENHSLGQQDPFVQP